MHFGNFRYQIVSKLNIRPGEIATAHPRPSRHTGYGRRGQLTLGKQREREREREGGREGEREREREIERGRDRERERASERYGDGFLDG